MLFLSKKTIVSVLALGTLLSISPRMHAVDSPLSLSKALALAAAAGTVYAAGIHNVDHTKKDKAIHIKAFDTTACILQSVLNFVTSKRGLVALGAGAGAYALVVHGKDVKNVRAVRLVTDLLQRVPQAPE